MESIGALIVIALFFLAVKKVWKSTEPPPTLEEYLRRNRRK